MGRMCPTRGESGNGEGGSGGFGGRGGRGSNTQSFSDAYSGFSSKNVRGQSLAPSSGRGVDGMSQAGEGGGKQMREQDTSIDVNKLAEDIIADIRGKWKTVRDIEDSPSTRDEGRAIERNPSSLLDEKREENEKIYMSGKGIVLTITGSRTYKNAEEFAKVIKELEEQTGKKVVMIQQGGAKGADEIARQYAYDNGLSSRQFDADWTGQGLKAGVSRNSTMIKGLMTNAYAGNEKIVMAIYDSKATVGTSDMLKKSMLAGFNTKYYGITRDQYRDEFVVPYLSKYATTVKKPKSINQPGVFDDEDDE